MNRLNFILGEAWHELRAGLRTPLVLLMSAGLIGYLGIVLVNADYLRDMGATNLPRNSANLVYLMTSGQSLWMLFAWAWIFAQGIVRERNANLHEVVLAAPVSLRRLITARYLGAVGVAVILGAVSPLAFLIVHPMEAAGIFSSDMVADPPWIAMGWSILVLVVPTAVGLGSLYMIAVLRTRTSAGPFAISALLMAMWMLSMVLMRGGDVDPVIASIVDPSAYAEVEEQANAWTPAEKIDSLLVLSTPLIINRLLWSLVPLAAFVVVATRLHREQLVIGRPSGGSEKPADSAPSSPPGPRGPLPPPVERPRWIRVAWLEAARHLSLSIRGWGLWLSVGLLFIMGIAGTFVHVVAHADGPLDPRPELVTPLLIEFFYLIIVFMVAGFTGSVMRRDDRVGFDEMTGATPAPLGVRLVGCALAAGGLAVGFAMIPAASSMAATALVVPGSLSLLTPVLCNGLLLAPALLELCMVTVLLHALVRRPGVAYSLSMLVAFIAVLNDELTLVTHPLGQLGLPASVTLSELVDWSAWMPLVTAIGAWKLAVCTLLVGLSWLAWPRGTAVTARERLRQASVRLRGGAGLTIAVSLLAMGGLGVVIEERLTEQGDYASPEDERLEAASWERRWRSSGAPFELDGGDVDITVDPERRVVSARWHLQGIRTSGSVLHGELPSHTVIERAVVEGREVEIDSAHDHFAIPLPACASRSEGCAIVLELERIQTGWPVAGHTPWLSSQSAWMRAEDLLPRLGLDPQRSLRAPVYRQLHGLPEVPVPVDPGASVSSVGVAPEGEWSWTVRAPEGGWALGTEGQASGPLDFVAVWRTQEPEHTTAHGLVAVHGPSHSSNVAVVLEDVDAVRRCVDEQLGFDGTALTTVVQAPRGEALGVHGGVLWLPEDQGWDATDEGRGRSLRRTSIARALASEQLARRARLREQPGTGWLRSGVAGWVGLHCLRHVEGEASWLAMVGRGADDVVEALGALDAPVAGVAADGGTDWVDAYAPLATTSWALAYGEAQALRAVREVVDVVGTGESVAGALGQVVGPETAAALMGVPRASDLALLADGGAHGERWSWHDGGWQSAGVPERVVQVGTSTTRLVDLPEVTAADDPPAVVVMDAWFSFERSIEDNVWSDPTPPR